MKTAPTEATQNAKVERPGARILILDLETAPLLAYAWGRWKQNIGQSQVVREGYVLCACWQWLGHGPVESIAVNDRHYGLENEDEKVVRKAWELLNEADIVVAYNGRSFDIATLNTRFLELGLGPPSPYRIVDPLETVKKKFRFSSNSMNNVSKRLGYGEKHHTDFSLWVGCMEGCKKAWKKMVAYCKQDVALLRKDYLRIRPWMDNHPSVSLHGKLEERTCPKCGSAKGERRGFACTGTMMYRQYVCKSCGGWYRSRYTALDKDQKKAVYTNAVAA